MSYTLTVTNGSSIVVQNGTIDTSTSLQLVGKNYPSYGLAMNQNLVNLLQSSAGTGQPASALTGQLWWDTTHTILKIYTGTVFKNITSVISSASAPASAIVQGDLWFDSSNLQLYVYTGTTWLLIGPSYSSSQQKTTAVALNILDNSNATHTVLAFYVANLLVGLINKDAAFTPATPISGFATVNPGYNVNSTIYNATGILVNGTLTTNAQPYVESVGTLNKLTVSGLITSSGGMSVTGSLTSSSTLTSSGGMTVSGSLTSSGGMSVTGSLTSSSTLTSSGGMSVTGSLTSSGGMSVTGSLTSSGGMSVTGSATFSGSTTFSAASITFSGIVNHSSTTNLSRTNITDDFTPTGANTTVNIGNTTNWFNTVYALNFVGTSVKAKYADLAENYISDTVAAPNAIMVIGGDEEVTVSAVSHDPRVIGVMSQNPAYLMNSEIDGIGSAIALAGRVPVQVRGPIARGDCVVSSDIAGVGEKLDLYRYTPGCIVGKTLAAINDDSIQTIEVVIGVR
jgi:hypothetical protein